MDALAALMWPKESEEDNASENTVPNLARVYTRIVVGPESGASSVVPGAAVVDVSPWERNAVQETFAQRRCHDNFREDR